MFGYVLPNLESLDEAEKQRYRAVYCGVCRSLKDRYGQLPCVTVSFDMTFLALFLGSMYEPEEERGAKRCPIHPMEPQSYARTEFSDYAADLSVAFAYHKLLDDWRDDRSVAARVGAFALRGAYAKAKNRIPAFCSSMEEALKEVSKMEQDPTSVPFDAPANRFGLLLGEAFVYRDDFWATQLQRFGARLGKFVYVMDAAMDLEQDLRTGSYNPFIYMNHDGRTIRSNLEFLAAGMTEAFERLPLERDVHLLRSVLYAGVWQRFEAKEKKNHHG